MIWTVIFLIGHNHTALLIPLREILTLMRYSGNILDLDYRPYAGNFSWWFHPKGDISGPPQCKIIDKILKVQGAEADYDSPGPE